MQIWQYNPISSWIDWQKIVFRGWKYHQSIEEGVGIPKRQELSKLGGEEKSYGNFSGGGVV